LSQPSPRPRALVTGAGVRLGQAIAVALAQAGFDLVLHYHRSSGGVERTAEICETHAARSILVQADLGSLAGCAALADRAGPVDVLINNAALYSAVPFAELTAAAWDRMQAVNCRAPALLAQALLPGLQASHLPGGGVVVNICDIGGDRPAPGFAHYSVSKAGLLMLTRALAVELAPRVRVNSVSPGTVLPPEDLTADTLADIRRTIPAGRFGSADDIARAVVFFVRDAPYVTGQDLAVCGGRSVAGPMLAG